MPETKQELKQVYDQTKKMPNERVVQMQREIIQLLGYDPDFGVSCLNRISKDFPNDPEIAQKMQYFVMSAEMACK